MRQAAAAAAAVLAAATQLAGCITPGGCGVDDDYEKGTDGEWVLTRALTGYACPVAFDFEQMVFVIAGDTVTVTSPDLELDSARVYQDGERQLVEMTVREHAVLALDGGSQGTTVVMTYTLELVPVTARLEGTMTSDYHIDPYGSCDYHGTASAGRAGS